MAKGSRPSFAVRSTGRRIEWLSISISTMRPNPAPMPPTIPAAAISLRFGLEGLRGMFGCSISEKRSPLESTSMRSPTWAWPTLATAALYWFWVLVSSRSSAASTCSLAGVAWIEAVRSASVCSIAALSSWMNCSRASIGASSRSSPEAGSAALPSAPGTARPARCSATSASSAATRLSSILMRALPGA